jgi:hypothetical protein
MTLVCGPEIANGNQALFCFWREWAGMLVAWDWQPLPKRLTMLFIPCKIRGITP